jgi:hypothetical protein
MWEKEQSCFGMRFGLILTTLQYVGVPWDIPTCHRSWAISTSKGSHRKKSYGISVLQNFSKILLLQMVMWSFETAIWNDSLILFPVGLHYSCSFAILLFSNSCVPKLVLKSKEFFFFQVIYTTGRDRQVQNTIVADSGPLVTTPVMVSCSYGDIPISKCFKS